MSIEIKQKIKEVADDFGMPAKSLIEIVGKFYDKPKSSSQNLTEDQLNVIFDYITAQNQIGSIAEVFAAAKPKEEPKAGSVCVCTRRGKAGPAAGRAECRKSRRARRSCARTRTARARTITTSARSKIPVRRRSRISRARRMRPSKLPRRSRTPSRRLPSNPNSRSPSASANAASSIPAPSPSTPTATTTASILLSPSACRTTRAASRRSATKIKSSRRRNSAPRTAPRSRRRCAGFSLKSRKKRRWSSRFRTKLLSASLRRA